MTDRLQELEAALSTAQKDVSVSQSRIDHAEQRCKQLAREHEAKIRSIQRDHQQRLEAQLQQQLSRLQELENAVATAQLERSQLEQAHAHEKRQIQAQVQERWSQAQTQHETALQTLRTQLQLQQAQNQDEQALLKQTVDQLTTKLRQQQMTQSQLESQHRGLEYTHATATASADQRLADLILEKDALLKQVQMEHQREVETKERLIVSVRQTGAVWAVMLGVRSHPFPDVGSHGGLQEALRRCQGGNGALSIGNGPGLRSEG